MLNFLGLWSSPSAQYGRPNSWQMHTTWVKRAFISFPGKPTIHHPSLPHVPLSSFSPLVYRTLSPYCLLPRPAPIFRPFIVSFADPRTSDYYRVALPFAGPLLSRQRVPVQHQDKRFAIGLTGSVCIGGEPVRCWKTGSHAQHYFKSTDHSSQIMSVVVIKNIYCTKVSKSHEPRTMNPRSKIP